MVGFLGGAAAGATVTVLIQAIDKTTGVFAKVNKSMLLIGGAMVAVGAMGIGVMSGIAKDASDLGESMNAVRVVFGDTADDILKIGENAATSFGMSKAQFNSSAVRFSAFASVIAGEGGDVAKVIETVTGRTADFASVMNIDLASAQTLIQAGLAGETEGLRRYGIDVSAASVKTYAYANGIAVVGEELTEEQKILARYGTIMEQTDKTAGDFANTSDDLANRQRILDATTKDLRASLGEALLPAFEAIVGVLLKVVGWFSALPGPVKAAIAIFFALVAVLLVIGGVIIMLTAVTAAFTAVNWWWIAVVLAIIAVIGALVAAGIWMWKNWERVVEGFKKAGIKFQNIFIVIRNVVISVWNSIIDIIERSINWVVKKANWLIDKVNAVLKFLGLKTIPLIGEVSLEFAKGTMMALKEYIAPVAEIMEEIAAPEAVAGVLGGVTPESIAAAGIPDDIGETTANTEAISDTSKSSSVSLGHLESINTRIANGVSDLVTLAKSREQREYNINIENINGLTGRDLANALQTELNKKMSGT